MSFDLMAWLYPLLVEWIAPMGYKTPFWEITFRVFILAFVTVVAVIAALICIAGVINLVCGTDRAISSAKNEGGER
jgi:hypothetical protein